MYEEIKAEIERRMDYHYDKLPDADSPEEDWTHNELCELGAYMELEHLETFIESLEKEQYPLSTKEDIVRNIKCRINALKSLKPEDQEANKGNLWELEDLLSMIEVKEG